MMFRGAHILLIEDSPADARYTQLALEELGIANKLTVLADGEQAIFYLYRKGEYANATPPDCILLDWNLPKADGSEVLEIIRRDRQFDDIPVIVLTGSREQTDVLQAYALKASGYITKPVDLSALHTIMDTCDFRIVLTTRTTAAQAS
ncbi:MAG TPA: response regulator [Bryobacteraceae bacterium]|nr:response regulator [Bryobacteraceae bacterium]